MTMGEPNDPPSFLERRPLRRFLWKALDNWRQRHQHPFSFWIHLVGIPLALLVAPALLLALPWDQWPWALAAFTLGYLLQWLGHLVEGNTMGELIPLKKALSLPYVAIVPRERPTASE